MGVFLAVPDDADEGFNVVYLSDEQVRDVVDSSGIPWESHVSFLLYPTFARVLRRLNTIESVRSFFDQFWDGKSQDWPDPIPHGDVLFAFPNTFDGWIVCKYVYHSTNIENYIAGGM